MIRREWDPRNDAWLAGFTDGEGSFILSLATRYERIHPRFVISLRADDVAILKMLQGALGGSVGFGQHKYPGAPKAAWHVVHKRDLPGIVDYFDRFPLRAKKARDYAIWREGVGIYLSSTGRDPRLVVLREALREGRAYSQEEMDQPDPSLMLDEARLFD